MKRLKTPRGICSIILFVTYGVESSTIALAQTTNALAPAKIEEITVTAQKRSENIRKVPVSITVLSGKQIKLAHIQNFADLTRAVPNLSFSSQAGEGLSTLEIRGIASQAGTATVAIYLDDVSLTTRNLYTTGASEPRFLDIARLEVLRGPQSTLWGASALGGMLRYVSNGPKIDVTEGNLFSEISGTDHGSINWDQSGVINIPISPGKAALRIAADTEGDSGYIDRVDPITGMIAKSGVNSNANNTVRATMLLTPNDWLTITPMLFWQKSIQRDSDVQYTALPSFQTIAPVPASQHDSIFVPSLTLNADLDFARLVSVTSNYERHFVRFVDSTVFNDLGQDTCSWLYGACTDPAGNPVANDPTGLQAALKALPAPTRYNTTIRQWSQEIRLVSLPYSESRIPFTWIAGLYYADENTTITDREEVDNLNQTFADFGVSPLDPSVIYSPFPGAFGNNLVYNGYRHYDTAQYAAFGEFTYYPLPNVRLTAGGRYSYARDGLDEDQNNYFTFGNVGPSASVGHFTAFTPKFSIGWDVTSQNTIYANAAEGYRLGSENRPIPYLTAVSTIPGFPAYDLRNLGLTGAPISYGADKLWNFELGDKARMLDGRVQLNADLFYILWNNIQQDIPLVTSGYDFETNAGNAKSYGLEADARINLTDQLSVGVSGSLLQATLDSGVKVGSEILPNTFAGEAIPGVPQYNFDFNARRDFVVNDRLTGFGSFDVPWVGDSHGVAITTNPDYKRPAYVTLDAVIGADYGRWEFTLFGKNLTNQEKIIQRPDFQGLTNPLFNPNYLATTIADAQGFSLRPLTVGVNAAVKF